MAVHALAILLSTVPLATHPTLYYGSADVSRLRTPTDAAQLELHSAIVAGAMYASTDPSAFDPRERGIALMAFALDCAITGDATVCNGARRWLDDAMANGEWNGSATEPLDFLESGTISGVSLAYDVLSDRSGAIPTSAVLSDADALAVRTRLAREAERMFDATAAGANPAWWSREYSQNHNWENVASLGLASIVLQGDLSPDPTCRWLGAVVDDFTRVGAVLDRIPDGTWHEGYSYEGSSVAAWLKFVIAWTRARTVGSVHCPGLTLPDFAATPWFRAFAHYRAVGSLPGREHQHIVMHGDWFGWSNDEVSMALRFAASQFHDGEAEWLARRMIAARPHNTYGFEQIATGLEYVAYDPAVPPTPPSATDLFLSDLQGYIARDAYDPNAAVLGVKAGAFGGVAEWNAAAMAGTSAEDINFGHDHDDDLGFWFYAGGEWLAPEADGYATHGHCWAGSPYVWNASYHNTLTIDGAGQIGDDDPCRDSADGHVPWSRQSSIAAHTSVADHVYVAMDGRHLYPDALGLDTVSRQVFFLDRRCVVVRDVLHANAPHRYEWNSHALDAVVREGDWIRAEAKNDLALGVRVIAPAVWTMETTQDMLPHGPNADVYIDSDETISHYLIAPASDASEARFLVVMCPATLSQWKARPTVSPAGDVSLARGFTLDREDVHEQWLFGDSQTSRVDADGTLQLSGVLGGVEDRGGGDLTYVLVRGGALSYEGREAISGDATNGSVEARVTGSSIDVSSDAVAQIRVHAPGATSARWNGTPVSVRVDPADSQYVFVPGDPSFADGGAGDAATDGAARLDAASDAGRERHASGCGCRTAGRRGGSLHACIVALAALAAGSVRRRARRRDGAPPANSVGTSRMRTTARMAWLCRTMPTWTPTSKRSREPHAHSSRTSAIAETGSHR